MNKELKKWLIPKLRKFTLQWPARQEAVKAARDPLGGYLCALCQKRLSSTQKQVDHINPVHSLKEVSDWNKIIEGMFSPKENWQVLCLPCHKEKNMRELKMRSEIKSRRHKC